jgi:hypothetical protein
MSPLTLRIDRLLAPGLLAIAAPLAQAQGSCSSDGQLRPLALVERFISADCESCWGDPATPAVKPREVALDWIVPGARGEEAPLSAAATRDGLARLAALQRAVPAGADVARGKLVAAARSLRVAQGPPLAGYLGASIELKPAGAAPWRAWLVLVETIPAGTEGTPVPRNLVRNMLQPAWDGRSALSKSEQMRLFESRPMSIPAGANVERLRVVGWVEDARGHIRAIAQSRCAPDTPTP